jgi:hypothetical protein
VNFVDVHMKILSLRVGSYIHIDADFRFQKFVEEDNIGHAMIGKHNHKNGSRVSG